MGEYTYSGVMYGLMIVGFLALWAWAWSSKRKPDFDEMSRLPLEDDETQLSDPAKDQVQQQEKRGQQ